jgi:hypothetical protein
MVTSLNTTVPQRDSSYQMVGFLRRSFVFGDFPTGALTKVVGGLPANAQVLSGYIVVTTACVGGTLNVGTLDYDGTTAVAAAFASAMVITATTGPTPFDDILLATAIARTVPTQITVTASATLTAGAFDVIVLFAPKNPAAGAGA